VFLRHLSILLPQRSNKQGFRPLHDLTMNDMIIVLLAALAHLFGGSLGCAIITLSLGIRVALLPLTLRLARRARRNQEIMRALQPEIEQLKKRFARKPERVFEEIHKLYRKHDCSPFDIPALVGSFIQLPIFGMLYSSIRTSLTSNSAFLWVRNLASPDLWVTLVILSLTGLSAYLLPATSAHMRNALVAIQMFVTFVIVWKLAAGLGLYWMSSNLVGLLQTLWLRYRYDSTPKPAAGLN
jgi:YidC/Oxa1 family membrane protein insertase